MNRARRLLEPKDVAMVAINVGEDRQAVQAFVQDYPIEFNLLLDSYGNISQRWQVRGLPTTFILNPRGEIVYRIVGEREWDNAELLEQISNLKNTNKASRVIQHPKLKINNP